MSFVQLNAPKLSPIAHGIVMALVYGLGVPLTKLLDAMGTYSRFSRVFRNKIYTDTANRGFGDYQPIQHDVLVCAYPRSGTNWMLQMAYQIAFQGQGDFEHIHDVVPWPDALW